MSASVVLAPEQSFLWGCLGGLERAEKKLRSKAENWLQASTSGFILDFTNTCLSLVSCVLYVIETYQPKDPVSGIPVSTLHAWDLSRSLDAVDLVFTAFFLFDFLVHLFAAESRLNHLWSMDTLVDGITIVPQVAAFGVSMSGNRDQLQDAARLFSNLTFLRFTRVFRVLRILRINRLFKEEFFTDVDRQIFKVFSTLMSIAFIFAGVFYICETLMLTPEVMQDVWGQAPPYRLQWHDAFYFTIITISTVGYGDFSPVSVPGKIMVMVMTAITVVVISKQTNRLLSLMSMQSVYARNRFMASKRNKHVVVCGNISVKSARDFLEEFFHPDHGQRDAKIVILSPHKPSMGMEFLLRSPEYQSNTIYLEGSAMQDSDLLRACVSESLHVFILANKFCADAGAEDAATVLRAMNIKKHVAQRKEIDIPVMLQLIRPENKHQFTSSVYGRMANSQVICMDEIKLHLLAKSVVCPGFSTMVSNLVKSFSVEADDKCEKWLQEYAHGTGQEIYRTRLSAKFAGFTFSRAAQIVYKEFSSTMFGIEVEVVPEGVEKNDDVGQISDCAVMLNPLDFVIPSGEVHVFVLADDQESADKIKNVDVQQEGPAHRIGRRASQILAAAADLFSRKSVDEGPPKVDGLENAMRRRSSQSFETEVEPTEDVVSLHGKQLDTLRNSYHIVSHPVLLSEASKESVQQMRNHVLLCGNINALFYFAATLRTKASPFKKMKNIVILHPDMSPKHWQELELFPNIFYVQGSALEPTGLSVHSDTVPLTKSRGRADLTRAGVAGLHSAVVLSHVGNVTRSTSEATDYLQDADSIFAYQAIKKVNPSAHIICEVVNSENISFLPGSAGTKQHNNDEFKTPQFERAFAAGNAYVNSILDMLACQSFYNRYLVSILRELIVSGGTNKINTAGGAYSSSDLVWIAVGPALFGGTEQEVGAPDRELTIDNADFVQWENLFEDFTNRKQLPLGVYRTQPGEETPASSIDADAPEKQAAGKGKFMPYLITNPFKELVLRSGDFVYSLKSVDSLDDTDEENGDTGEVWESSVRKLIPVSEEVDRSAPDASAPRPEQASGGLPVLPAVSPKAVQRQQIIAMEEEVARLRQAIEAKDAELETDLVEATEQLNALEGLAQVQVL